MTKAICKLLTAAILLGGSTLSYAGFIYDGQIQSLSDTDQNRIGSSVSYLWFNVNTAGTISFDLLSWEADDLGIITDDGLDEPYDVNGNGRISFFDTAIHLFMDDGAVDEADYLAGNDDDLTGAGVSDGSISDFDSYLSLYLDVGRYMLAISTSFFDLDEALAGFNNETFFPASCDPLSTSYCDLVDSDSGDFRLTVTGDVTQVPEPYSAIILLSGLLALYRSRAKL